MDDQSLIGRGATEGLIEEWRAPASIRHPTTHRRSRFGKRSCGTRLPALELSGAKSKTDEHLAVFSHELRGSLGAIRNAVHILGRQSAESLNAEKARLLIERQVARMTRLTDDLIEVARAGREAQHLSYERLDLCVVVKHSLETVESEVAARKHRLVTSLPEVPVWLQGDADRLEQVLVNLLVNAAKYTDLPGNLFLSVEQIGNQAVIRVRDSGIGIAADVLPRIFDPFMQANPTSRLGAGGIGIGLGLVRRLVELHRGSVSAASAGLGQGSEFVVRLPALCANSATGTLLDAGNALSASPHRRRAVAGLPSPATLEIS
jgi:two-component system CheB/CheR fusion protein